MSRRGVMVELARGFAGCKVTDPDEALLDLLAPPSLDSAALRADLKKPHTKLSTCALFARGLFRLMDVRHDRLSKPYVIGAAVDDVVQIAKAAGAWRAPVIGGDPHGPVVYGDVVLVGGDPVKDGGHEHVYVVTTSDPLTSVDGGQTFDGGFQGIKEYERTWSWTPSGLWDRTALSYRRVVGWCDLDALLAAQD